MANYIGTFSYPCACDMRNVVEVSKNKRKYGQGPPQEVLESAGRPYKRHKETPTRTTRSSSQNGNDSFIFKSLTSAKVHDQLERQETLEDWLNRTNVHELQEDPRVRNDIPESKQSGREDSDSDSLELDCVMLTPSSSIDSQSSPHRTDLLAELHDDSTCEDSDHSTEKHIPMSIFSHMPKVNDDLLLSKTQGKTPVIKNHSHQDEGGYNSKIKVGQNHQAIIPKLITERREVDMRRDMEKIGTLVWEPLHLKDSVIEEYEEFCKSVVRSRLSYVNDNNNLRDRDRRYLHDKALEVLHNADYNIARAKEIIVECPEMIIKKELCRETEAMKVQLGFQAYGKDFTTIRREMLFDEVISVDDMVNFYYMFKKRIPNLVPERRKELRIPIIYQEDEEENNEELEYIDTFSHIVQFSGQPSNNCSQHNLDLITPPPSPLSITSPHELYHHIHSSSLGSMDNLAGSGDESSLSHDDFFIPIESTSSNDHSVNFNTYDGEENIKIDDLFSLSNTL